MKNREFAYRALCAICLITILTGLASALASHAGTQAAWELLFDIIRWPRSELSTQFSSEARILSAVTGGVLVGWGVAMLLLARGPIKRGDADAWKICLYSVLSWFVVDTSASFAAGWPGNVVLNVLFLTAFVVPLWALWPRAAA